MKSRLNFQHSLLRRMAFEEIGLVIMLVFMIFGASGAVFLTEKRGLHQSCGFTCDGADLAQRQLFLGTKTLASDFFFDWGWGGAGEAVNEVTKYSLAHLYLWPVMGNYYSEDPNQVASANSSVESGVVLGATLEDADLTQPTKTVVSPWLTTSLDQNNPIRSDETISVLGATREVGFAAPIFGAKHSLLYDTIEYNPAAIEVRKVEFYLDGFLVAVVGAPPYQLGSAQQPYPYTEQILSFPVELEVRVYDFESDAPVETAAISVGE